MELRFAYFIANEPQILDKIERYAAKLQWAHQENDAKWQTPGLFVWLNFVVLNIYKKEVDHLKSW